MKFLMATLDKIEDDVVICEIVECFGKQIQTLFKNHNHEKVQNN
jgi:hypothetical protein